jgi:phage I-like protein
VQIATPGVFKGHSAGPFELNDRVFNEIIANFRADPCPIPWDYEHASEQDPTSGSIPLTGAPAQGWIHDLVNRGRDGLWALTEFLEPLKTMIREKKYRYCSPAVRLESRDRVTGKPAGARLTSCAATNSPFLRDLRPLAATDKTNESIHGLAARLMSERGMSHAAALVAAAKQLRGAS